MYQQIMYDVHRQWLEEFDHKAALKRQLPRRKRSRLPRRWLKLAMLRHTRPAATTPSAAARRLSQAQQCS